MIVKNKVLIIGGISILIVVILTSLILVRKKKLKLFNNNNSTLNNDEYDVILMGGLDNRQGDKNITQQVNLLQKNAVNKKIIGLRYKDILGVKETIIKNPNSIVVLFSAGASNSSIISKLITDKNNLFIVEPYATSSNVTNSVKDAILQGVPTKNVITGATKSRGNGVVEKSTKTPQGIGHWESLEFVGTLF